jgi:hypothetical protein
MLKYIERLISNVVMEMGERGGEEQYTSLKVRSGISVWHRHILVPADRRQLVCTLGDSYSSWYLIIGRNLKEPNELEEDRWKVKTHQSNYASVATIDFFRLCGFVRCESLACSRHPSSHSPN